MFVTYDFYKGVYLMDDPNILIPEKSFAKFAQRAWFEWVNWRNLQFDDDWIVPIYVQMAICGVAELLYLSSLTQEERMSGIRSFTNDGYGISFSDTAKIELQNNIHNVIAKYVAFTEYHRQLMPRALGD